ncbi:MAG: TetR/AcrR family transcriptional regulator [Angelakisella sp.]
MGRIEEKQSKKRKEIALKAIPLIDQYGFNNISVADLCKKMNISVGSFYHYFKDKNDVIMELFFLIDNYYKNYVEEQIKQSDNKLYAIKVFCMKYGYYSMNCGLEVCRQISLVPLMSYDNQFMSKSRYMNFLLTSIIKEGQEKKQITTQYTAEQLSDLILAMIRGYCFDWCKKNAEYDIVKAIELHCHMILNQVSMESRLYTQAVEAKVEMDSNFDFYATM